MSGCPSLGFPAADDIGNMFQFGAEFEEVWGRRARCGAHPPSYPGLQSLDAWLARNASRNPVPAEIA